MPDRLTIVVTKKTEVSSGVSKSGRAWTLYVLSATDASGAPLNLDGKLKTFDDLPERQAVAVEVERSESAQYGVEYMARASGSTSSGTGKTLEEHRQRLDSLEARMNWLFGALRAAGVDIDAAAPSPAMPEPAEPDPGPGPDEPSLIPPEVEEAVAAAKQPSLLPGQSSGGAFASDDDIPF